LGQDLQARMSGNQLVDSSGKTSRGGLPDLQAEPAQDTAQAHLDVVKLRLHQLARGEHRTRLLRTHRLAMYRTEPAHPDQFGDPVRVLAVRLHRHRLEGIAHVPRLQKLDRKPRFPHRPNNHCDSGPASNPIRSTSKPSDENHPIKAAGSLATLPSRTIRPCQSTTHRLELSKDTSIPA